MEEIFITRQAIFNSHLEIIGYELLFYDGTACRSHHCSDAEQSTQLIANTFMGFGLENLVGSNRAFINLSHDFFSNEHPIPMASYQLVLEVPGSCIEDDQVYLELKQLAKQGYSFSLYDYEYNPLSAERLDCIDIVKLDINNYDTRQLKEQSRHYRNHGKRIHIKGLETESQQLLCSQLGIDYFQGSLFATADLVQRKTVTCSAAVLQEITACKETAPGDISALAHIISQDPILSYALLRYINCASFSQRTEIRSLEQALTLIGASTLKQWATLLLSAHLNMSTTFKKPDNQAQRRACLCQRLALRSGDVEPGPAFLTGLLSSLETAMETPLEDLLDALAVSPDIAFALLYAEGPLGHILQQAMLYENKQWHKLDSALFDEADIEEECQAASH